LPQLLWVLMPFEQAWRKREMERVRERAQELEDAMDEIENLRSQLSEYDGRGGRRRKPDVVTVDIKVTNILMDGNMVLL
jgi:hypothetical protein